MTQTLTAKGAAFVGAFEGFSATVYNDNRSDPTRGNATIGYGHLIHYGPPTDADRRKWGAITRAQATTILQADARLAMMGVERHITIRLWPWQRDALCSFAFNCGPEALAGNVARAVNAKPGAPWKRAAWRSSVRSSLLAWDHVGSQVSPGLRRRRQAEGALFTSGRYVRPGNPYANA